MILGNAAYHRPQISATITAQFSNQTFCYIRQIWEKHVITWPFMGKPTQLGHIWSCHQYLGLKPMSVTTSGKWINLITKGTFYTSMKRIHLQANNKSPINMVSGHFNQMIKNPIPIWPKTLFGTSSLSLVWKWFL